MMISYKRYSTTLLVLILLTIILYMIALEILSDASSRDSSSYDQAADGKFTIKPEGARFSKETKAEVDKVLKSHESSNETDKRPSLMQYLQSPFLMRQFNFMDCAMSNCFNFSRCLRGKPLRVHIVPSLKLKQDVVTPGESNMIHRKILQVIKSSKHFEPDSKKACIFVLEEDTLDRDPLSQSFESDLAGIFGPERMYGMNHLVFNLYSGTWPDYKENDFAGLQLGAAIIAKASNSISHHRRGFDISLPLFSYQHPMTDMEISKEDVPSEKNRTLFLTFKGKRYVIGKGSETRNNLYHIDNQRDVIMLTTCRHGKRWKEANDNRCLVDEINYDKYDFVDLMKKSLFCLTPRGRRLGSFRHLEAMSYGCIPVILSDGWVKPFDEIIDWSNATVDYAESSLLLVPDMLRDIDISTARSMREICLNLYDKYFSSMEKIILTTLEIIERRINDHIQRHTRQESVNI